MPRLPDISALGNRPVPVNRQGIAQQDTTAEGRGIAQFGQVIGQIGEEIQKKNDEQAVFEARRKLDQWERDTLYDPEKGVVAKRGIDALDLPNKISAEYDKFSGEVGATLSSNRQRQVFQEMAQARRNQVADFTIRHAVQQKEVYEKGQVNADMLASNDRAVLLASNGNLGGAKAEIGTAMDRLTSFMKARGASGEEIALALKTNSSSTHEAVVRSLVTKGDPLAAQTYFDANAGSMLEKDKLQASGVLREGVLRAKSQAFGDEAMASGMDMKTALSTARQRFSGDEEVAATHEIKTRFAEQEAARAQAVRQVSTDAWSVLMAKGSMSAIPPQTMATLRTVAPEEERQMRDWLEAKQHRAKADAEGKKAEDWGMYMMLRDKALENPEEFNDPQTLLRAEPYLSKGQMAALVNVRSSMSKDDIKASQAQATIKRAINGAKTAIESAGVDMTPGNDKKKQKELDAFMGSLDMALQQATHEKGRALDEAEAKKIAMSMLREGFVQNSGFFSDDKKRAYQLTAEEKAKFVTTPYDKIPQSIRNEINADLRKRNGPPGIYGNAAKHEAEVERIYQRAIDAGAIK